jgi:hypothetical protein
MGLTGQGSSSVTFIIRLIVIGIAPPFRANALVQDRHHRRVPERLRERLTRAAAEAHASVDQLQIGDRVEDWCRRVAATAFGSVVIN